MRFEFFLVYMLHYKILLKYSNTFHDLLHLQSRMQSKACYWCVYVYKQHDETQQLYKAVF